MITPLRPWWSCSSESRYSTMGLLKVPLKGINLQIIHPKSKVKKIKRYRVRLLASCSGLFETMNGSSMSSSHRGSLCRSFKLVIWSILMTRPVNKLPWTSRYSCWGISGKCFPAISRWTRRYRGRLKRWKLTTCGKKANASQKLLITIHYWKRRESRRQKLSLRFSLRFKLIIKTTQ